MGGAVIGPRTPLRWDNLFTSGLTIYSLLVISRIRPLSKSSSPGGRADCVKDRTGGRWVPLGRSPGLVCGVGPGGARPRAVLSVRAAGGFLKIHLRSTSLLLQWLALKKKFSRCFHFQISVLLIQCYRWQHLCLVLIMTGFLKMLKHLKHLRILGKMGKYNFSRSLEDKKF